MECENDIKVFMKESADALQKGDIAGYWTAQFSILSLCFSGEEHEKKLNELVAEVEGMGLSPHERKLSLLKLFEQIEDELRDIWNA